MAEIEPRGEQPFYTPAVVVDELPIVNSKFDSRAFASGAMPEIDSIMPDIRTDLAGPLATNSLRAVSPGEIAPSTQSSRGDRMNGLMQRLRSRRQPVPNF